MASSWGDSWGSAWGDSWGGVAAPVIVQPSYWVGIKPQQKPAKKVKAVPVDKPEKTLPVRRFLEAGAGELALHGYPASFIVRRLLKAQPGNLSLGGEGIEGQVELASEDFDFDGEAFIVTEAGRTRAYVGVE